MLASTSSARGRSTVLLVMLCCLADIAVAAITGQSESKCTQDLPSGTCTHADPTCISNSQEWILVAGHNSSFPPTPLLVGVASCRSIKLKWRAFDDDQWVPDSYALARMLESDERCMWKPLLNGDTTSYNDADIQPENTYLYRLQTVSKGVHSAYAYANILFDLDSCTPPAPLGVLGYFIDIFQSVMSSISETCLRYLPSAVANLSTNTKYAMVLVSACFISVYLVLRAAVRKLHVTRSRSDRLKQIKRSAASAPAMTRASLQSSPRSPPMSPSSLQEADVQLETSESSSGMKEETKEDKSKETKEERKERDIILQETASADTISFSSVSQLNGHGDLPARSRSHQSMNSDFERSRMTHRSSTVMSTIRAASLTTLHENGESCHSCHRRFGLFRRRHVCDVCGVVSLCRKCGKQLRLHGNPTVMRRSSTATGGKSNDFSASGRDGAPVPVKVHTICRDCRQDLYRYSTGLGFRTSYQFHGS